MTQQQIDRVEEIREKVESVTSGELRNCDYEDAVNMNNELRDLISIIDQLRAEPTLLEKLLKTDSIDIGINGKFYTLGFAFGLWTIDNEVYSTFEEFSQHLSQLLEKEV